MRNIISFLLFFLINFTLSANLNLDSLKNLWNNTSLPDTSRLNAVNEIAKSYLNLDMPDSALCFAKFQYDFSVAISNKKQMANALNYQGNAYSKQSNFDKSLACSNKSIKIKQEIGDLKNLSSIYISIGNVYAGKGDNTKGLEYYKMALDISMDNNKVQAAVFNNMGSLSRRQGNYEQALIYYKRSLKLKKTIGDKKGIGNTLNNIGNIYFTRKNYEQAISYYQKSLTLQQELDIVNPAALCNIGNVYFEMGDYEKALTYCNKSLSQDIKMGNKSGIALLCIGKIYLAQGNHKDALNYFKRSVNINLQKGASPVAAESLICLGKVYLIKGDIKKAKANYTDAFEIAQEIGAFKELKEISEALYKIYKDLGDKNNALIMHETFVLANDSLAKMTAEQELYKFEIDKDYELKKQADSIKHLSELLIHQKDIIIKDEKLKSIYTFVSGLTLIGILAVAFVIFLINRFLHSNNQKRIIENQHFKLDESHKELTDSIKYAQQIQKAILTSDNYIANSLQECFILFKPKDVVSGDFYWVYKEEGFTFFTVADCTGHGVPGAFMSMLGISFLNEIIIEKGIKKTDEILNQLSGKIKSALNQKGVSGERRDGMDIAFCCLNTKTNELFFSGARNPLILIRNNEILEFKSDKRPVGYYLGKNIPFTSKKVKLQEGDVIHIYSDGFSDQFGGKSGKKYKSANFKKLLLSISDKSMNQQNQLLSKEFDSWKGDLEQIDDVCVMGVRI